LEYVSVFLEIFEVIFNECEVVDVSEDIVGFGAICYSGNDRVIIDGPKKWGEGFALVKTIGSFDENWIFGVIKLDKAILKEVDDDVNYIVR
jgi:hypothetical protein